jgi:prepilin peptidase CpaA
MIINFLPWFPGILLGILLSLAVWNDIKSRLIPNKIVFSGSLIGIALNTLINPGAGLFNDPFGGLGILNAIAGLGVGLIIMLPLYALHAMGAGDVKLMAMIGTFIGPLAIIKAALFSMVAGGLLALIVALWQGVLQQVLANLHHIFMQSLMRTLTGEGVRISAPEVPTVKLAYAIAIATGTVFYLSMSSYSSWSFI